MLRLERPRHAALVGAVLHLPFVLRYDLHFQPDFAISVLMSRAIAFEGARPVFFWGQPYLGTWGCYLTAALFRLGGVSVPLAGLVSLGIWAVGVGLVTRLAGQLLGSRGAWWTGLTAAVASPYANHYVTQPFSSYETAPVLAVLVFMGTAAVTRLTAGPLTARAARRWLGLGVVLGVGWWTTRLFLPALVAAGAAVLLGTGWDRRRVGRALIGLGLLAVAALVGDLPERLHRAAGPAAWGTASLGLAPLAQVPANLRQALASLPAYLDGDPEARRPEGVTFAQDIFTGQRRPGPPLTTAEAGHDALVRVVVALLLITAAFTAVRAWRTGDVTLFAVCLMPFVHLALIGLSAQTRGSFHGARRYWFASLLVLPLLIGIAIELLRSWRPALGRVGAALVVVLLASSLVSQARLLTRPDELADYRRLVRELTMRRERVVWMASWNAWVLAALSDDAFRTVSIHYDRRADADARLRGVERIAVVWGPGEMRPLAIQLSGTRFVPGDEPPHATGTLRWAPYRRERARADHSPGQTSSQVIAK